ncbi:MAG: helix-turn-helix domain-containing protein [Campylobacteraceae bacterium]|jgi:predicted DNA-binding transcriptional regulator AlpA|nr:helix-turn-helix domain-containing protein [Campylobacteraceae bacterium]
MEKNILTLKDTAEYLGLSVSTLYRLKRAGLGAKFIKLSERNSKVFYRLKDLDEWLDSRSQKTA